MADILDFKKDDAPPVQTRQQYIEALVTLGAEGNRLTLRETLERARTVAWREAYRIADGCAEAWAWEPEEREHLPLISSITDVGVLTDLANTLSVMVSCDRELAEMDELERQRRANCWASWPA